MVQHEDQCLLDVDSLLQVLSQLSFAMDTHTRIQGVQVVHEIENESVNDDGTREIMLLWLKNLFLRRECPRKTCTLGL